MNTLPSFIIKNEPLARHTYYKIGGSAEYFAEPKSIEELKECIQFIKSNKLSYWLLGAGSNILIQDAPLKGVVVSTSTLNRKLDLEITPSSKAKITAGCSIMAIHLLRKAMSEGLEGLECIIGIPGCVGGMTVMNAGTKVVEFGKILKSISVFNLKTESFRKIEARESFFSYRENHFLKKHDLVYEVEFELSQNDPLKIQEKITSALNERKASQPIDKPSCGSVFKNPDPKNKVFSWKLISDAGLRGLKIGNAQVSELHTNFIINLGGATAQNVLDLIAKIKETVLQKFNIQLEEEVKYISQKSYSDFSN